ncbi:alpha/beta hydrolase [Pseudonocardiaceae bacterium YIM PH 21723]|nr:alpha/beta hydrolase [Pseudonocardiaceae bacterium YIM PH 21723]
MSGRGDGIEVRQPAHLDSCLGELMKIAKALAVAAAISMPLSLLAVLPAAAAPIPQKYSQQKLNWGRCVIENPDFPDHQHLECTMVTAPMDWNNPGSGKDITVAISRRKGKNAKQVLFTNPGGPGGAGRDTPALFDYFKRTALVDSHDIIGIDVRGTGASTNVACGAGANLGAELDYRDRSQGTIDLMLDSTRLQSRYCQVKSGEFGKFVNTEQTVKDYDLIRALLGAEKINYVGYSGGSWIGAYYATYFPQRVGRFVLDSNADFTAPWQKTFDAQPEGFERRYREQLVPWLAKYDHLYHQGTKDEAVRQNYERLRAALATKPVQVNGQDFHAIDLDNAIGTALYGKRRFAALGEFLAGLNNLVDGARSTVDMPKLVKSLGEGAEFATATAIMCNDTRWRGTDEDAVRKSGEWARKYPLVGGAGIRQNCFSWQRPALTMKRPDGRGVPPVLMVQNELDPATPAKLAEDAHRGFAGSRLLRIKGEGDHGGYATAENQCANEIVEAYLIDGKVPANDPTCQADGLPVPGAKA